MTTTSVGKRPCPFDQDRWDNKRAKTESLSSLEANTASVFQQAQSTTPIIPTAARQVSPINFSSTVTKFSPSNHTSAFKPINPAPQLPNSSQSPSLDIPVQNSMTDDPYVLGNYFCELEKYDEAIKHLSEVPEAHPEFGNAQGAIGFCYYNLKKYDEAIEHWSKVPETHPKFGFAQGSIGTCYSHLEKYDKAIEYWSKVPETHPYFATAQGSIGFRCYHLRNYSKALEHYSKVPVSHSRFADAQFYIGLCRVAMAIPKPMTSLSEGREKTRSFRAEMNRAPKS